MSNSVRPHRWKPTRLLHPWDFPGKSTGVGCQTEEPVWLPSMGSQSQTLLSNFTSLQTYLQTLGEMGTCNLPTDVYFCIIILRDLHGSLVIRFWILISNIMFFWDITQCIFVLLFNRYSWRKKWDPTPVFLSGR